MCDFFKYLVNLSEDSVMLELNKARLLVFLDLAI